MCRGSSRRDGVEREKGRRGEREKGREGWFLGFPAAATKGRKKTIDL